MHKQKKKKKKILILLLKCFSFPFPSPLLLDARTGLCRAGSGGPEWGQGGGGRPGKRGVLPLSTEADVRGLGDGSDAAVSGSPETETRQLWQSTDPKVSSPTDAISLATPKRPCGSHGVTIFPSRVSPWLPRRSWNLADFI